MAGPNGPAHRVIACLLACLLACWRSAATMGFRRRSCVSCVRERFKSSRRRVWQRMMQRSARAGNCRTDKVKHFGESEAKFVVAGLSFLGGSLGGSLDGWSGLCSWLDRPQFAYHAMQMGLQGLHAEDGPAPCAPSQSSFLGPPPQSVCTKTGSPRCSFTLLTSLC